MKKYLDETRKSAAQDGYVETLLGRAGATSRAATGRPMQRLRNREEREAINAPIQGTAADIMKIAMLHIPSALRRRGLQAQMLLQVHDELVLEVPKGELEKTARLVQKVMASAYKLDIPLSTEARWGQNWGEMSVVRWGGGLNRGCAGFFAGDGMGLCPSAPREGNASRGESYPLPIYALGDQKRTR